MCRPAEISTNCTRSQLKGPCAAVRMAGMTKHGCHRTLRTTCLTHSICILAGCEWVGFWWLLIIYVPQSSIRHHCSKVHCSKLAWFAGAQHPISLLGRDARREDASCLFLAAMGGIRHQIKLLLIGVGRAQSQSTTIISDHQIINSSTTILHILSINYDLSNGSHGGMVISGTVSAGHLTLLPPSHGTSSSWWPPGLAVPWQAFKPRMLWHGGRHFRKIGINIIWVN